CHLRLVTFSILFQFVTSMCRKVVYCLLWAMVLQVSAQSWSHANAFSCREASNLLSPCLAYLMGGYSSPTAECCQGVSALKNTVKGKADLRSCCECMKEDASGFHFIPERAAALPNICKVRLPVPLNPEGDYTDRCVSDGSELHAKNRKVKLERIIREQHVICRVGCNKKKNI
ncbi:non-specific lipid-transfer protein 1-like, partial [Sesamum indicum]|uniref:Non-specific lipid-transfer protein 1-like n=1 Tax=Sesamum indicum TaxID=4182 RepID=A0A8M8VD26_SESIN